MDFVVPGEPAARVTPCSFMQLRYAANAVLLGPLNPPVPPVWYFAQACSADWNFGLLPNPLAPAGGPPVPAGGAPPDAPEGGELNPAPLGSLTPCWARQVVNAVVPADELEPLAVVVVVVFVAELLPHAASARLAPIMPRITTGRLECRRVLRG